MNKVGLVFLVIATQNMVLQAIESETPMLELKALEVKIRREVQASDKFVDEPVSISRESSSKIEGESKAEEAEAPSIRRLGKHHSTDKSVAGGGVILGGLVTVTFAAFFCYIRVTRKTDNTHH